MFAGVKPQRPELKVLVWREHKSVPHSHDKAPWPVGCHQTIKANIRFHLYGGPQGWNPHSFGPERSPRWVINPSDFVQVRDDVRISSDAPLLLKGIEPRS